MTNYTLTDGVDTVAGSEARRMLFGSQEQAIGAETQIHAIVDPGQSRHKCGRAVRKIVV
jgi:hypothetical protein